MTRTIWLASYPKSGNTWLRILIANATIPVLEPIDINQIPDGGMASDRSIFDYTALIDSGLLTHDEVDSLRPHVYAEIARDNLDRKWAKSDKTCVRFVKVHDAYTMNSAGEPLLGGAEGADAAIVIVRDPRDVAPSLAHHLNYSIDKAISFMNDDDMAFYQRTNRQSGQLRQKLRGWGEHAASCLDQVDIPLHLVRYEDLLSETASSLRDALQFAGFSANEKDIDRAIAFSDFAQLQQQEEKDGFAEAPPRNGRKKFFRRGEAGSWRDELSCEQVARIESHHGGMMRRLGYQLSYSSNLAYTG